MSNQNLNTLNVETLNFTGPTIYHRGRPWFPDHSDFLCCTYLGVGLTVDCPPNPPHYPPSLQVTENAIIHDTLFVSPIQGSSNGFIELKSISNPLYGPPSNQVISTIKFTNDHTTDVSGFKLGYNGYKDSSQNMISDTFNIFSLTDISNAIITINGNTGYIGVNNPTPIHEVDISGNVRIRGYLDMSCNPIKDVSGIFFCADSSGIDMSCNNITDISGLYFCDASGSSITGGGPLDISANTVHITNTNLIVDGSGLIQTLTVGLGGGDISSNTVVGYQALQKNTAGGNNVATGL